MTSPTPEPAVLERSVLQLGASVAASQMARMPGPAAAGNADPRAGRKWIGIQVGSVSFVDEGVEPVLEILPQKGVQSLVGSTVVRDQAAGVVSCGLKEDLLLAAAGALDPGAEEHVGLPDLIGERGFVLFMRGGFVEKELTFGEAASAQETIERGGRKAGLMSFAGGGQFAQQSGSVAMRVLALEPFDESGGVRRHGAGLPAVLSRFGR